tara:strand:- start:4271 stop:4570 length:300 start_codon:yes stop_codon:yes gene_type:complete
MANTTLTFNENTYEFKLHGTRRINESVIVLKDGSVIINGSAEYFLTYSYNPNSDDDRALYEVFNVDDTDNSFFSQYGEQGFPFYMVQAMVSHIMKQKKT